MRPLLSSCLCLVLLSSAPADDAPGDDAPVARLGDRAFERDAFEQWLVERVGVANVQQFVVETLVLERAEARGLAPEDGALAARYEQEHEHMVQMAYGGKEERWLADITASGYSPEGWKRRRLSELRVEMAQEALVRADRRPDEALVEKRFRDVYGTDGERTALQALFFSAYRNVDPDAGRPDLGALKADARRRASEARDRWVAGASLDELLEASDTGLQRDIPDGRLAQYRRNMLGREIEQAVASLDRPGEISLPVDVFDGTWIVKLEARTPVTLEEVHDELMAQIRDEPVSSGEMAQLQIGLLEQDGMEILLR